MGKAKGCLGILFLVALLLAILFGGIRYRIRYAKTEIVTQTLPDGRYTLTIYMIGEPDWPFGATHCRADLTDGSKRIVQYPFSISDDGATAHVGNFDIQWQERGALLRVSGSEQEDAVYVLNFDGTVE